MLLALLLLSDGLSATPPETRPFGWKCALCSSVGAGVLGMAVMTHSDVTGLPGRSSLTAVARRLSPARRKGSRDVHISSPNSCQQGREDRKKHRAEA